MRLGSKLRVPRSPEHRAKIAQALREYHLRVGRVKPRAADHESRRKRLHRYGPEAMQAIDNWDGRCQMCLKVVEGRFNVDHDHDTGRFRGLLCYRCNLSLGLLEAPGLLQRARVYLARVGEVLKEAC